MLNLSFQLINNHFFVVVKKLTSLIEKLNVGQASQPTSAPAKVAQPAAAKPKATPAQADDDDDVDLFGSDDEVDEEAEKLKRERVAAYTAKKSKSMFIYHSSLI